jgi:hypothetical protein
MCSLAGARNHCEGSVGFNINPTSIPINLIIIVELAYFAPPVKIQT